MIDCQKQKFKMYLNFFHYAHQEGLEESADYPSGPTPEDCNYSMSKVKSRIESIVAVSPNSTIALKSAIAKKPVVVSVDASKDVFLGYKGGILDNSECGTTLNTELLAVGYGS